MVTIYGTIQIIGFVLKHLIAVSKCEEIRTGVISSKGFSNALTLTTGSPSAPSRVTNVAKQDAFTTGGAIGMGWAMPHDTGGLDITKYEVYYKREDESNLFTLVTSTDKSFCCTKRVSLLNTIQFQY